jgi:uncharacterized membrane protein
MNSKLSRQQRRGSNLTVQQSVQFSGPMPPPSLLEKYEAILPGAAERMMKMAENQSQHRHQIETKVIEGDIRNSRWGLRFAFVLCCAFLAAGFILVREGHDLGGSIMSGTGLVSIVGTFIYGSRSKATELARKADRIDRG